MTEANGKPPVIEGPGRYVVYAAPDGGWVIARAVGICDTCQGCGCGEKAPLVPLPDFTKGQRHIMAWAMAHMAEFKAAFSTAQEAEPVG